MLPRVKSINSSNGLGFGTIMQQYYAAVSDGYRSTASAPNRRDCGRKSQNQRSLTQ